MIIKYGSGSSLLAPAFREWLLSKYECGPSPLQWSGLLEFIYAERCEKQQKEEDEKELIKFLFDNLDEYSSQALKL